jgi:hypothetical protein
MPITRNIIEKIEIKPKATSAVTFVKLLPNQYKNGIIDRTAHKRDAEPKNRDGEFDLNILKRALAIFAPSLYVRNLLADAECLSE